MLEFVAGLVVDVEPQVEVAVKLTNLILIVKQSVLFQYKQ